jgi:hypothetical protein
MNRKEPPDFGRFFDDRNRLHNYGFCVPQFAQKPYETGLLLPQTGQTHIAASSFCCCISASGGEGGLNGCGG